MGKQGIFKENENIVKTVKSLSVLTFTHKKAAQKKAALCPRLDSNQHAVLPALPPQSSVSTNFTTRALNWTAKVKKNLCFS